MKKRKNATVGTRDEYCDLVQNNYKAIVTLELLYELLHITWEIPFHY